MSLNAKPSLAKRYSAIFILGIACIVGYGLSKSWFGFRSEQIESKEGLPDIHQSAAQAQNPARVTNVDDAEVDRK